ncbi:MAG: AAA domain-containing protein, partial [Candidatus Saccharimonadales bacterium]
MISLKQLAKYCRDYIDLVSPSLLSRQAKQVVVPKEILDATPLYQQNDEIDYESLTLPLNLEPKIEQLDLEDEVSEETDELEELTEEDRNKLAIARVLDDIYRKYETSSYTKQVSLRFGRVSFQAQPINDSADEEVEENAGYKRVEQHLFSVPVSISYSDSGGARHYSLIIEDTMVTTNVGFLNEFLPQENRDELFKFIAQSEAEELTSIPIDPSYVDELWSKITHLLREADARDISPVPDMDNVLVILLPKVNYFLSQDLQGIIEAADDEAMLDTSLSAWVDDRDMSISESSDDDGSQELFFPFPYDNSQLQVLGKLGNRAAVVEGPPGTGKSQTIANILSHLAATGQKVLFVSQKDQAVRGVKDKLKTLDIPYLYGYLPDRSSRLHSEDDEKDSAANSLKGIAQALYNPSSSADPKAALVKLHEYKPQFDTSIESERKYFDLHNEWLQLDAYDFGENSPKITQEWHNDLKKLLSDIDESQNLIAKLEDVQKKLAKNISEEEGAQKTALTKSAEITKKFSDESHYDWIDDEHELLRGLTYADVMNMMHELLSSFEDHATDRKSNFIKSKLNNMKLTKELNSSIESLPREMYESLREIVFSEDSKTKRFMKLKEITAYFSAKDTLDNRVHNHKEKAHEISLSMTANIKKFEDATINLKEQSKKLTSVQLEASDMRRIDALVTQYGATTFESIAHRYELKNQLDVFKILNPNLINEEIIREKSAYKSNIRDYLKNRLALRVEEFRRVKQYRATLESIGRKLSKTKKAYKTFDALKSNPENFDAMSGIIPIWMMGLDDASRVLPLAQNIFDYVIIDEASQCNISYALPAMYRSKHTILFGDTLQMRDTTTAFKSNERLVALANKHKIPEDLQIKATEDSVKSVMDIAKLAGFQTTVLRNHYRSPVELIGFSNEWFYEPRGRKLQVINDDIIATDEGRVLTNHIVVPNSAAELSEKTNVTEAVYIRDTLLPKIKADPQTADKSIAILTFFNEQAELLRRVITDDNIKISVIEGIQGDEKDIVIYSFVIKSPQDKRRYIALTGESGEIRKEVNEGRVNVAFSRARLQVHAVTSIAPNLWPDGIWIKRYLEYVEERGRVNRLTKSDQQFDSKFEENVYDFLFSKLDAKKYTLTTQVESCGFKIDLVIRSIESGKKLAIEMDGPTHFEAGDGQVRVANDYERQFVLETAGWRFYRVIYSEWLDEESKQKQELLDYVAKYMKQAKPVEEDNSVTNEPVYVPLTVEVSEDFVNALKASTPAQTSGRFGRKPTIPQEAEVVDKSNELTPELQAVVEPVQLPLSGEMPEDFLQYPEQPSSNPVTSSTTTKVKRTPKPKAKTKDSFEQLAELNLSARRSIVISKKPDGSLWLNEKLSTDTFTGFTSKGFGIQTENLLAFIEALNNAIASNNFEKEFVLSDSMKLVVHNPDNSTVDIRYYRTSDTYT